MTLCHSTLFDLALLYLLNLIKVNFILYDFHSALGHSTLYYSTVYHSTLIHSPLSNVSVDLIKFNPIAHPDEKVHHMDERYWMWMMIKHKR